MPSPPTAGSSRGSVASLGFWPIAAGLIVLVVGLHLMTLREGVGWHGDSYQFLLHAENLAEGRPYADTGYIQNPDHYLAPVAYPMGFPALLTVVIETFGINVSAFFVLMTLVWGLTVAALAGLLRHELPASYLYGLVLVVGLQPYIWLLKHDILSDLPFFLASVLSLLCYERSVRSSRGAKAWAGFAVLSGVVAAYAIATRPLALVLLPSFLLYDLVRARRPTWAFATAAASCCLAYGLYVASVDLGEGARVASVMGTADPASEVAGGGYGTLFYISVLQQLGDIPHHVVDRLVDYARASFILWQMPVPGGDVLKNILMGLSLVLVGLGFVHRARSRFGLVEIFVILYALSLLPWSFSGVRYIAPLVPFYYFYLFVGLERLHARRRRGARAVTVAVVTAIVVVYTLRYVLLLSVAPKPSLETLAADPVYVYLREETPPATVFLATGDPRVPVFFSRRAAAIVPRDRRQWADFAERLGSTYLLVGSGEREDVAPYVSSRLMERVATSVDRDLYVFPAPADVGAAGE